VYVRHGAASVPATDNAIRKMTGETDGDSYDKLRSVEQNLQFASAIAKFTKINIPFGCSQMRTLGIVRSDGIFTNLGLLLSEQCVHATKTAVSQDATQQIFKDRRNYLESSLCEALLNAIVHRECATSGNVLVKIYSDRLEFISPGV
jgi:ATP-dependent DNA helicase RecG